MLIFNTLAKRQVSLGPASGFHLFRAKVNIFGDRHSEIISESVAPR